MSNELYKVIQYINSAPNLNLKLERAYKTIKLYTGSDDFSKRMRGEIGEIINRLIVDDIIKLNPNLGGKAIYGGVFAGDSKSTEIDSILTTNSGIYVIEVKCLYGKYDVTSDGYFTRTSPSPLKLRILSQNSSHCRYIYSNIKKCLKIQSPYSVKGIIVIAGDCQINDLRSDTEKEIYPICHPWDLPKYIYSKYKCEINSEYVYNTLMKRADFSKEARERHIQYYNKASSKRRSL